MTSNLLKDYENKTVSMSLENKASLDQVSFEKLDIKDVSFRYPTRDDPTLFDINLTIKKGEAVGIIGPSGSGKSTLIDLLLGFLEPDKGEILLNNSSIFNDLNKWRDKIAFMPQQVYLIDDSIVRNVALGLKDDEIDYSQINKSLEAAQLIEYIKELPDGYRTLVGERGAQMSGGQRQRIALARAFYFGRDILILDEATSSLDNETEKEIIKNIKSLKGEKTLIVIAHRLSTLVNCDRVYEIGGGNIINEGTYEKVVLSKD